MVTILKKLNLNYLSIKWKIFGTYLIIILLVILVLSSFLLGTLQTYLFDQRKVDILTNANIVASVISDNFSENSIKAKIPQLSIAKNARVMVVNEKSNVIFDSYADTSLEGKTFINAGLTDALLGNGKDSANYYKDNGNWYIEACVPVIKSSKPIGAVYFLVSGDSVVQIIQKVRYYVLILGVLIIIFVGIFSSSMASILTLPIGKLTKFINNMPKDSLQKTEVTTNDEIGQLAEAFNNLIDRQAELEEKRRAFVSDASHELKTPLSIIKLLSDSLIQSENPDSEFVKEFLGDMNKEIERLTRIIERLLNLTKMDSRQLNMHLVPTNLKEVINEIYDKLLPWAENKNITLTKNIIDENVIMPMERDSLTEAIYNITDNSIKYTESGGDVTIELNRDLAHIFITISDTGIGIPKEETQKIFDRFYRVDKARARETGGTGLGLSIARDAVKLHGGYIEVSSEENCGSKFTIVLPYEENPALN